MIWLYLIAGWIVLVFGMILPIVRGAKYNYKIDGVVYSSDDFYGANGQLIKVQQGCAARSIEVSKTAQELDKIRRASHAS